MDAEASVPRATATGTREPAGAGGLPARVRSPFAARNERPTTGGRRHGGGGVPRWNERCLPRICGRRHGGAQAPLAHSDARGGLGQRASAGPPSVRSEPRGRWIRRRVARCAGRGCAGRRNGVTKGPGDAASCGAHGPRAAGLAPGGGRAPSRLPMNSGSASTPCPTMSATFVASSERGPGSTRS